MNASLNLACVYVVCCMGLRGMALAQPPNDSFSAPTIVEGFPASVTGNNVDATLEHDEPTPYVGIQSSVWFLWEAPATGYIRIQCNPTDFSRVALGVWTGTEWGNLALVSGSHDNHYLMPSPIYLSVTAGVAYRIAVYGVDDIESGPGGSGSFSLKIELYDGPRISGTVTGPDGLTPLQGIRVASCIFVGFFWEPWRFTTTDANGHYTLLGIWWPQTWRVVFSDPSGDHQSQAYDGASDVWSGTDIDIASGNIIHEGIDASLATASKISGTVTGPDGTTPLQGIQATAYRWNDSGSYWESMDASDTDTNGEYTISGLPAGTCRVQFQDWRNGDYLTEVYDNAPDLDSGTDIVVPAETTVTGINASLASIAPPAPPRIVALRPVEGNDREILYIGTVGREYILQETSSLTKSWDDVGTSFVCQPDTNTISRQSSAPTIFWRIREFP